MARKLFTWLLRATLVTLVLSLVLAGGFIAWAWAPDRPAEALMARWGAPTVAALKGFLTGLPHRPQGAGGGVDVDQPDRDGRAFAALLMDRARLGR